MEHARGLTRALCLRNGEEAIVQRAEVVPEERAGLCNVQSLATKKHLLTR